MFTRLKMLYDTGRIDDTKLHNAVGKYITAEQYKEICGNDYVA